MPVNRMRRQHVYAVPGGSLKSFLQGVNKFLRKHKVISNVAKALPMVPYASTIGNVASSLGYGRKRRRSNRKKKAYSMHGLGALSLPGGAIRRTRHIRRQMY